MSDSSPEILFPGQVNLAQLERIFRQRLPARLDDSARPVSTARRAISRRRRTAPRRSMA